MKKIDVTELSALPVPKDDEILFCALGGVGEIGMNAYLYGHKGQWLVVDCGVSFGTPFTPGIDVLLPDLAVLEPIRDRIAGLVLTHGHEDHLGAIGYLYDELGCTVHATPFAAALLADKLRENHVEPAEAVRIFRLGGKRNIGPFDVELVEMGHSIPEAAAVAIRTSVGTVIHTGDWKADPTPEIGEGVDTKRLREIGKEGVLAVVSDSTNAMVKKEVGSEADVYRGLLETITPLKSRVAVACFATNVSRIQSVVRIAEKTGRRVCLVGRSMLRVTKAALETGYLKDLPSFVDLEQIGGMPRDEVMLLCTGSQGESRAALSRIAFNQHRHVRLEEGDNVLYSSRMIPGNEVEITRVQNALAADGINVITDYDMPAGTVIHVSGHPGADQVAELYEMLKPAIVVPVHGEARHLAAHAVIGRAAGAGATPIIGNGDVLRIGANGGVMTLGKVHTGKLGIDGDRFIDIYGEQMRERRKMGQTGVVHVSVAVTGRNELACAPTIACQGVLELPEEQDVVDGAVTAASDSFSRAGRLTKRNDDDLGEHLRLGVRRYFSAAIGNKPLVNVSVLRV